MSEKRSDEDNKWFTYDFPLDRPPWWRPLARHQWDKTMRVVGEWLKQQPPKRGPYR